MKRLVAALVAALSVPFLAPRTEAGPITFVFEGTLDIAQGPLLDELLAPGVTAADLLGTTFHGSYTFEADAPDTNGNPQIGSYQHSGAPLGMEFHFDHRSFSFDGINISITDDIDLPASVTPGQLDDIYAVQSVQNPTADPLVSIRGRLDLRATGSATVGPSAITSDVLPLLPPDITAFDEGRVFVNVVRLEEENGEILSLVRAGLGGTLTSLRVPEPSSIFLVALGMGAMARLRRRRSP